MKAAIGQMRNEYAFSERRACALMSVAVGTYRYLSRRSDEPLRSELVKLARRNHGSAIGVCTYYCRDRARG